MATRSYIRVILKEEDRNKDMKFNPSLIGDETGKYEIGLNEWGRDQLDIEHGMWETVNPNGSEALRIYHHWDGYPDGVGATLVKSYNSYDKALNLVLGGDCSTINSTYNPYALRKSEDWDSIKPAAIDENEGVEEEYDYMFKDGEWYVRAMYGDKLSHWTLVSKVLEKGWE